VSQFIFLNPFWLMLACKSILRHDLSNAIKKIVIEPPKRRGFFRDHDCPVISKDEVVELWTVNAKKGDLGVDQRNFFKATKACLGKLEELDRKLKEVDSDLRFEGEAGDITPYDFLARLLVNFNVFVPVDLNVADLVIGNVSIGKMSADDDVGMYFLPSLIDEVEPPDEKIFNPKCDPAKIMWQMTLSQSFVIKNVRARTGRK
jgi:hypothetical protein